MFTGAIGSAQWHSLWWCTCLEKLYLPRILALHTARLEHVEWADTTSHI